MIQEVIHALGPISADESVKVVIIKAEGKNFCAGHYLPELQNKGVKSYK